MQAAERRGIPFHRHQAAPAPTLPRVGLDLRASPGRPPKRARSRSVLILLVVNLLTITAGIVLVSLARPGTAGPYAPSEVRPLASSPTSVTIGWQAPPNRSPVDHFVVMRDGRVVATVPAPDRSYRDGGLSPGRRYLYEVGAVTARGHRAVSTATAAVTATPSPTGPVVTSTVVGTIGLEWGRPPGSPVPVSYSIIRDGRMLATVSGAITSYTDSRLPMTGMHQYQVEATWGGEPSPPSAPVSAAPVGPPPSALTAAGVTATSAVLYWYPPSGMGLPTSYRLVEDGTVVTSIPGASTTSTVTDLQPDTRYDFQVSANWGTQTSELSPTLEITTPASDAPLQGRYLVRLTMLSGPGAPAGAGEVWAGPWEITPSCATGGCPLTVTGALSPPAFDRPFAVTVAPSGSAYTGSTTMAVPGCPAGAVATEALTVEVPSPGSGSPSAWSGTLTVDTPGNEAGAGCAAGNWTYSVSAGR